MNLSAFRLPFAETGVNGGEFRFRSKNALIFGTSSGIRCPMHGMSSTSIAPRSQPARLSDGEQRALLLLLADDDPQVYQTVRQRILAEGDAALSWVEPATRSNDPVQRRRAAE